MFEAAEADPCLTDQQAKPLEKKLRTALLKAQYARLSKPSKAMLIVVAGIDGAGKGASVSLLNEWMDARHIRTLAFGKRTATEKAYPYFWRYWLALPEKGKTGIVFGSWYEPLLKEAAKKQPDQALIQAHAEAIRHFEAMLVQDGIQIIKLWYHLSEAAQSQRVKRFLADPNTVWRVRPADIKVKKKFDRLRNAGALALNLTHSENTPWSVIPSADENMRSIATAETVLACMRSRPTTCSHVIAQQTPSSVAQEPVAARIASRRSAPTLQALDYNAQLSDDEYDDQLASWQSRLAKLAQGNVLNKHPLILVFEGQDAAGKGGSIRRITHALDARQFRAIPISAPSPEELAHPWLWRFWRALPRPGNVAIFDRSWYGRVLVERVEKYARPEDWQRAYAEINEFEAQLHRSGMHVVKFWLAITKDEQLKRFHEREASTFKSFKITPEDWRNRGKWNAYCQAADDMFAQTDTPTCPWHVLSANDKRHARVDVLQTIVEGMENVS
jgi:polyphosphate:AMP phosphotransferase